MLKSLIGVSLGVALLCHALPVWAAPGDLGSNVIQFRPLTQPQASSLQPGDLVLTEYGDIGRVSSIMPFSAAVKFSTSTIEYRLPQLVKQASGPIEGVEVGSFV